MLFLTVKPGEDVIFDRERIVVRVVHLLGTEARLRITDLGYSEHVLRAGHSYTIEPGLVVVLRSITRGVAKMGFIAPDHVAIQRRKVYERLHQGMQ